MVRNCIAARSSTEVTWAVSSRWRR